MKRFISLCSSFDVGSVSGTAPTIDAVVVFGACDRR